MKIVFSIIIVVALWCSSAEAAQIQNLSKTNQIIEIVNYGSSVTVTLAPGEIWRGFGRATVKWRTREVDIAYDEEYVIWDDETFGPQRRWGNRNSRGI
jgi:hypothetical protein